jgi:hypothetical protein
VLFIDDEELPFLNLFPGCRPLFGVKHYTQHLLNRGIRHVYQEMLCFEHSLFFVLMDQIVYWSFHHLIYGDFVFCIRLEDKAFLALNLKFLIHYLFLNVVCLPS